MRVTSGWCDQVTAIADRGLHDVFGPCSARRASPATGLAASPLSAAECTTAAALMRVNRAGEIAAQALYLGQALAARSPTARAHLLAAAAEEHDHLAWCTERLTELGGRTSLLDPLWFAGSVAVGFCAGLAGDAASLGFVAETETQVEAHLDDHLTRLPPADRKSRAILERMAQEERGHGAAATAAGGRPLPFGVRTLMSVGGGILRRFALFV